MKTEMLMIVRLLKPLMKGNATSKSLKDGIRDSGMDLDKLEAELTNGAAKSMLDPDWVADDEVAKLLQDGDEVENRPKPPPIELKKYYHVENIEGYRCFDIHVRNERKRKYYCVDEGSPPFAATRPGICGECGESFKPGDEIIGRKG